MQKIENSNSNVDCRNVSTQRPNASKQPEKKRFLTRSWKSSGPLSDDGYRNFHNVVKLHVFGRFSQEKGFLWKENEDLQERPSRSRLDVLWEDVPDTFLQGCWELTIQSKKGITDKL